MQRSGTEAEAAVRFLVASCLATCWAKVEIAGVTHRADKQAGACSQQKHENAAACKQHGTMRHNLLSRTPLATGQSGISRQAATQDEVASTAPACCGIL